MQVSDQNTNKYKSYVCSKFTKSPYCGSHVGRQKNAYQPIFPNNIIETSTTSLAHKPVFVSLNDFKFGTETRCMVVWAILELGSN